MNEIKTYRPLALVFYIDWNGNRSALPLDNARVQDFKKAVEEKKMIELEWVTINTYDIKEIRPAELTSEIEKYYYSRSYQERAMISQRVRNRVKDQKVNVLESLSELGTEKAIDLMQRWIEWAKTEQTTEKKVDKQPITEEQKEQIKARYQQILSQFRTNRWIN